MDRCLATFLVVLLVSACNGPGATFAAPGNPSEGAQQTALRAGGKPTPIPFSFQTVDNPNSYVNRVTSINQRGKIVGTYGAGSQSSKIGSYASQPPYTKFRGENYPGAQGTVATSLSSTHIIGGYVIDPDGESGIWAFLQVRGLPTLMLDPNEGGGSYAVTEILGLNDSGAAVGFYTNPKGADVPFELNIAQGAFADLAPPGAKSAQATGINNKGNVSGFETLKSGVVGFYMHAGTYYQVAEKNANATYAYSLNWQDQVVGSYQTTGKTHGFILTYPANPGKSPIWQTIDEPNAHNMTVVTGINNHDAICGWYQDKSGVVHGFVATPQ